jgi:hypothetical protein
MPALLVLLTLAGPGHGQEAPAAPDCTPEREGVTACFGEKLCACRFEPGGSLTGRPPGHRWDCGALRPACSVVPTDPGLGARYRLQDLPALVLSPRSRRDTPGAAPRQQGSPPLAR